MSVDREQAEYDSAQLVPDDVRDYLRTHPDFLADNGDLLTQLVPPARHKNDDSVQDFQHFMLSRLQEHISAIQGEHDDLLELMQGHLQRQNKINEAILSILDVQSFEETISCVTSEWTQILEQQAVSLFFEAGENFPHGFYGGAQVVAEGFVNKWMGRDLDSVLEEVDVPPQSLFGEAAVNVRSYALIRLSIDEGVPCGMLALGHEDPMYYGTGIATEQVETLGGVLERCVRRWLHQ